ncbi:hypothetical protein B0I28_10825 [Glycomyces artemisiae]|uniref:Uncharacterized protein n=1 Tax=Glycomyces artemisiae TaxID=1076443 RepID=A0A2T0UFR2_9ACTN|nr:hypothetical protein B0I28_10825 [Glycomyces artemisiae]
MGYAQGQGNRTGVGRCKQTKPSLWPTGKPDDLRGSAPAARRRDQADLIPAVLSGPAAVNHPPWRGHGDRAGDPGKGSPRPRAVSATRHTTGTPKRPTGRPTHTPHAATAHTAGGAAPGRALEDPAPRHHPRDAPAPLQPRPRTTALHCERAPQPVAAGHPGRAPTMPTGTHRPRQSRAHRWEGTIRRASTLPAGGGHGGTGNRGTNPGSPDPNRSRNQDRDRHPNSGPGPGVKGRRTGGPEDRRTGGGRNKGDKGRPHRRGPARHRHPTPAERPPTRARGQWVRRDRSREGGDTSCPPRPHRTRTPIRCRCRAPAIRPPPQAPEPAPPRSRTPSRPRARPSLPH